MRKWKKSSMKLTNQTKFKETELELIPKDWDVFTIPDIAENFDTKRAPLSSRQRAEMRGPYPYYGATGVLDYLNDYKLEGSYLLIAEDGTVTVDGKRPMLQRVSGKFWVSNHAHILKCKSDQDQEFLFYQLSATDISPYITGAVQLKLSQANLNKIPILWPQKKEDRKEIAEVLGALDQKIELNRKMNKTLDSLAQAVFKKWFIDDADPNWKTGKIGDISEEVLRGFTTSYVEKSNLINLNQKVNRGEYLDESNFKYYADDTIVPKNKFAKRGDILINSLGQGTLGRVHFYLEDTDNVVVDQHITIIRTGAAKLKPEYLYYYLTNCCDLESLITGSTGMLMLNISHIRNFEIQIPNIKIQNKFSTFVQSLNDKKSFNNKEIKSLSQIRDSLLPRLMSGKLRVK